MSSVPLPMTQSAASPAAAVTLRVALAYLLLYVGLDWVSYIHPMKGLNITPWNPASAAAVGLLLWRPRAWWLVWLAAFCSEALTPVEPMSWPAVAVAAATMAFSYAATALAVRHWLGAKPQLTTRRSFVVFVVIVNAGALLGGVLHVSALAAFQQAEPERALTVLHRAWVGDTVGLLVTLPLLLVLASRERRAVMAATLRSIEWWVIVAVAAATLVFVVAQPGEEQVKYFYLLFLPAAWGAARFGVNGAVSLAAVVQLLLIAAVESADYRPLTVFELQALMAALAAMGLLLGTTVDEREEAERELRESLRLAAAGDMAAALAHELNQPLSAMRSYARASQLLAEQVSERDEQLAEPLVDVTRKLVDEATRAGAVVRRLRNFFRDRTTELQPTQLAGVIEQVVRIQRPRAEAVHVRLDASCAPDVPPVWLDEVQIAVVLRNLVANAIDAASQQRSEGEPAWVDVRAAREDDDVTVAVVDSGAGLAPDDVRAVFEQRRSDKPGGMGVGLGISRSIVEAHGGRVWAEAGPGGRFHFSLPIASPPPNE